MQTTISLPKSIAQEVDKQVKKGLFKTPAALVTSAVKNFLSVQKEDVTWEMLAAPFRAYAQKKNLTEKDILSAVEKGRRAKTNR